MYQDTSREAFRSVLPYLPNQAAQIVALVRELGGHTDEEIADALGMLRQSVCGARNRLVADGVLTDLGQRRVSSTTGRQTIVWELSSTPSPQADLFE